MSLVRCVVLVLVAIGVAAAAGRSAYLGDFARRGDPLRQRILDALDREDPHTVQRVIELERVDRRFAAHPHATLLHTLPGGAFLILASLQFSRRLRRRHVALHRWSGRLLLALGSVAVSTGLYFGLLQPYAGWGEALAIALVGALFLTAAALAFLAIRRGQVARHREWMIRVFAVAIGISTVRVVALFLDTLLSPVGFTPKALFVASLWTGWGITLGAAELWIRHTRPQPRLDVALSPPRPAPP